ncbi:MAG: OmpA family protein [Spirochaetes bacterium]|nr:OmpA family protein [Spirochaetota bacterium]
MSYIYSKKHLQASVLIIILTCLVFSNKLFSNTFEVSDTPKNLKTPINSKVNDFAPTFSADGKIMIFNSNRNGKYQDLFISYNTNGKWSTPAPIMELNSPYNDETPFITYDGNLMVIFFSSDRDGSIETPADEQGQHKVSFDIYFSIFENQKWSTPQPVPGEVNTVNHEKYPSLSKDNKTLYYSTWEFGKGNKENLLVQATYSEEGFINRKALPEPFNKGYLDYALFPAEDLGGFFVSSTGPDSIGGFDLYFVPYKNGKFGKKENLGKIINSKGSEISLTRIEQQYFFCSMREDSLGEFDIYSSFIFQDENFETRAILFDYNSDVIKEESFDYLNALSKYLSNNPKINLEIIGHTDLHGSDEFNLDLSKRRAESVKNYLVSKGINASRLTLKGAGKKYPVINEIGEGYDEFNRRTEFKIKK